MKVLVRYQENLSMPQICCICGAPNPTIKYYQTKETRGTLTKARVKLRFMKCQTCADELRATSLTISRIWSRVALRAVAIGGGIGFLAGIALAFAVFSSGEFGAENTNNVVNDFLGPFLACASIPAVFGMLAGFLPAWLTWRKKIDSSTRQRLEVLQFPVKILDFGFQTSRFGAMKDPIIKLDFVSDTYGQTFMRLNNGFLA